MDLIKLTKIVERHKIWIESKGNDGRCADLTGADLREANLTGVNLRGAELTGVVFPNA